MENTERLFQCQQREVDWQEQLLQKGRQENEHLVSQMRTLQNNIESLNKEKEKLEDDCQSLEKKLSQTRRWGGIFFSVKITSDGTCLECLSVIINNRAILLRCPITQNVLFLTSRGGFSLSMSTADLQKILSNEADECNSICYITAVRSEMLRKAKCSVLEQDSCLALMTTS